MMKLEQNHKNKPEVYQYSKHISLDPEMQTFTRGETNWISIKCTYKIVVLGTKWL